MLQVINTLGERFVNDYIVNFIVGKVTPQIKMYRSDQHELFGCGNKKDAHFWNSLIRNLLLQNLLKKDIEEFGLLKLMPLGEKFLKNQPPLKFL